MNLNRTLYLRWVAANALGEAIGLGMTIAVFALIFTQFAEGPGIGPALVVFGLDVLAGSLEATLVAFAQWWAMHRWFPKITRSEWWLATIAGALIAYVLGFLPSLLMGPGPDAGQPQPAEPAQSTVLLLAAGLGLVTGAVLSFAQWLVLKRSVKGAGIWIPANMLAWAAGMPLIFWMIDAAQRVEPAWQTVIITAAGLLFVGALVGAIHGVFLVRMSRGQSEPV